MCVDLDVLDLLDGRVVAVGAERLHGVEQAVQAGDALGVLDALLEVPQPPLAVLVLYLLHLSCWRLVLTLAVLRIVVARVRLYRAATRSKHNNLQIVICT